MNVNVIYMCVANLLIHCLISLAILCELVREAASRVTQKNCVQVFYTSNIVYHFILDQPSSSSVISLKLLIWEKQDNFERFTWCLWQKA